MNTVPVPSSGVIVKDAAGVTYFLPPKIADATGVTDPVMKAHLDVMYKGPVPKPGTDPLTAGDVSAYGLDMSSGGTSSGVTNYDPMLANLYNLWANIQLCLGAKQGSDNYKSTYDVNGDGIIDNTDAAI